MAFRPSWSGLVAAN